MDKINTETSTSIKRRKVSQVNVDLFDSG